MKKIKCTICGYTYDEAAGLPEKGIAPGTKWEDIPHDFTCPWCGAPKTVFEEAKKNNEVKENSSVETQETVEDEDFENLRELTAGEISVLCSNLAKGCEKQRLTEEMDLFYQLADYYKGKVVSQGGKRFRDVAELLKTDLAESYSKANSSASAKADRGALRALVWSEKVSRMVNSLLDRYEKEGEAVFEATKFYVCDICGFIYAGNDLPEVCPVCKVPNFKISQIGRR
ncbi:rubredoxin [Desulfosporosinus youngiae]|uniref:Rubredoxin n=1 Tax=Desulfosporosinus youngiae DSM 17734 TaxID=768710 RepID=H5XYV9_9FIRM|nr:rubredoxin [Desulfosporosinus youngiae]EHQ91665.1 rubredoxin [Desulfosporosinus youngiae DSM 17734]